MQPVVKYLFKIPLLVVVFSCNYNKQPATSRISFKQCDTIPINNQVQETWKLSHLIDNVAYIPLETSPECMISNIKKVYFANNRFYIHDSNAGLLCFNRSGKFLFRVGQHGRGPGEFLSCDQVVIKEEEDAIWLTDSRNSMKVIQYDLNGQYIKEGRYNFYSVANYPLGVDKHCFYLGMRSNNGKSFANHMILMTDEHFEWEEAYLPFDKELSQIRYSDLYNGYFYQDSLSIKPDFRNIIYRVNKRSILARYYLDFGDELISEKELKYIAGNGAEKGLIYRLADTGKVFTIDFLLESSDFLFFIYNSQRESVMNYYSKTSKVLYSQKKFLDDIGSGVLGFPVGLKGEQFVFSLPADKLHTMGVGISENLEKLKGSRSIGDNPVLVLAKLKKI